MFNEFQGTVAGFADGDAFSDGRGRVEDHGFVGFDGALHGRKRRCFDADHLYR